MQLYEELIWSLIGARFRKPYFVKFALPNDCRDILSWFVASKVVKQSVWSRAIKILILSRFLHSICLFIAHARFIIHFTGRQAVCDFYPSVLFFVLPRIWYVKRGDDRRQCIKCRQARIKCSINILYLSMHEILVRYEETSGLNNLPTEWLSWIFIL